MATDEADEIVRRLTLSIAERWAESHIRKMYANVEQNLIPTIETVLRIDRFWGKRDYAKDLERNTKELK